MNADFLNIKQNISLHAKKIVLLASSTLLIFASFPVFAQADIASKPTADNAKVDIVSGDQDGAQPSPSLTQPLVPNTVIGQAAAARGQQWDANALGSLEKSLSDHKAVSPPSTAPQDLKTLFFTAWQYALLNEAKQLFKTRPPDASETSRDPNAPKPTGPREISLGGISFINGENWTVWLNSERIKPDAIPKQVLDIKVRKDHIDLKWYDTSTDLIYPVRLRPHQRFNLDTRIFLPGTGA